jgi:signal transduction histidine kinase
MLARESSASFRVVGSPGRVNVEKELAFYRIAQEALNNARRHAQARHIAVELRFDEAGVTLKVSDDGIGFDMPRSFNDLTRSGHFGLMGMHERAQLAGGRLTVTSSPGKGTTVAVSVAK